MFNAISDDMINSGNVGPICQLEELELLDISGAISLAMLKMTLLA